MPLKSNVANAYAEAFYKTRRRPYNYSLKRGITMRQEKEDKQKVFYIEYIVDSELVAYGKKLSSHTAPFSELYIRLPFSSDIFISSLYSLGFKVEKKGGALYIGDNRIYVSKTYKVCEGNVLSEVKSE